LARNLRQELRPDNPEGAAMPGSHAEEIVVDFLQSEDWAEVIDIEAEPDLDVPPLPPPAPALRPSAA
jgi:hypothetical protein